MPGVACPSTFVPSLVPPVLEIDDDHGKLTGMNHEVSSGWFPQNVDPMYVIWIVL